MEFRRREKEKEDLVQWKNIVEVDLSQTKEETLLGVNKRREQVLRRRTVPGPHQKEVHRRRVGRVEPLLSPKRREKSHWEGGGENKLRRRGGGNLRRRLERGRGLPSGEKRVEGQVPVD